jgi:hypothetical protein
LNDLDIRKCCKPQQTPNVQPLADLPPENSTSGSWSSLVM